MALTPPQKPVVIHRTINQQLEKRFIEKVNFVVQKVEKILELKNHWVTVLYPSPVTTYDELQKYLNDCDELFNQLAKEYEQLLPHMDMVSQLYPDLLSSDLITMLHEHYLALRERK